MSSSAAAVTLAAMRVTREPRPMMMPMEIFFVEDQLYGSFGSFGPSHVAFYVCFLMLRDIDNLRIRIGGGGCDLHRIVYEASRDAGELHFHHRLLGA